LTQSIRRYSCSTVNVIETLEIETSPSYKMPSLVIGSSMLAAVIVRCLIIAARWVFGT